MHKKLILKVFEKAKKDQEKETGVIASTSKLSERISETLLNNYKCVFGEKSLRVLYNKAKISNDEKLEIKQLKVIECLCKYLGYENYIDFVNNNLELANKNNNHVRSKQHSRIKFIVKKYWVYLILVVFILILYLNFSFNQQRWMIWKNDQYVEVDFDTKKYNLDQLKILNEERILNFKKIVPSCQVKFFDNRGKVKIWYGKSLKGELEIFTSIGLHPETGKTLKPITQYMIDKYFCIKDNAITNGK
ncbi:hypothetical protein [Polaribacter sp. R77954]|uniref:hypothetical protein n=1 Tax=Polaribacter sp. R77954 TaxID=3093870 RepID=UPI0037C6B3E7